MLFLRLAILSALSELVALAFSASPVAPSLVAADTVADAFFAFNRAAEVLFARLVVLVLLIVPLPVRLCRDGMDESGLSDSLAAKAGTEECRRALRATWARSVHGCADLTGEDSLNSKMASLSFSTVSSFTAGSLDSTGSDTGSSAVLVTKFEEALRFVVLVCSINAEMALEVVDLLKSACSGGDAFSRLSSFWRNGLPASASSSPASRLIATLPVVSGAS